MEILSAALLAALKVISTVDLTETLSVVMLVVLLGYEKVEN
jgi:hypothetical protein